MQKNPNTEQSAAEVILAFLASIAQATSIAQVNVAAGVALEDLEQQHA